MLKNSLFLIKTIESSSAKFSDLQATTSLAYSMISRQKILTHRCFLKVRALETLVRSGSLLGVVHEEEVEKTQTGRREPREPLLQVVVRLLLEREVRECRQMRELRPDGVTRRAEQIHDQLQLTDLRPAWQQWSVVCACHKKCQSTS